MKLLLLLFPLLLFSQNNISVSIQQDAKLFAYGDKIGNGPGTIDIIASIKYNFNYDNFGYLSIYPEYEYADININYHRASLMTSYTIGNNNTLMPTIFAGPGVISRFNVNKINYTFGGTLNIKSKLFTIQLTSQITQRADLRYRYNNNVHRFSGLVGIQYNFKKL